MDIDEDDLHAFLDGELPADREALVAAYLAANPDMRARFADFAEHKLLLRIHAAPAARPSERTLALATRLKRRLSGRWDRRILGGTAAAVLLLVGAWQVTWGSRLLDPGLPAFVTEAAAAHRAGTEVALKAKSWVEPGLGLDRMLSTALDEAAEVPELDRLGLRLVGWRLGSAEEDPVASLVYEDARGPRVTVSLSPRDLPRDEEPHVVEVGDLRIAYWSDGGKSFAVVADEDVPLEPIVDEIEHQGRIIGTAVLLEL
jgi:anti-sigma factor RsiW